MGDRLKFYPSGWARDFQADADWPEGWPRNIEYEDGYMDYIDPFVVFKAYDTSQEMDARERDLHSRGYQFACAVKLCYSTTGLWCEDTIARFPAEDKTEAEKLLGIAAETLYR